MLLAGWTLPPLEVFKKKIDFSLHQPLQSEGRVQYQPGRCEQITHHGNKSRAFLLMWKVVKYLKEKFHQAVGSWKCVRIPNCVSIKVLKRYVSTVNMTRRFGPVAAFLN